MDGWMLTEAERSSINPSASTPLAIPHSEISRLMSDGAAGMPSSDLLLWQSESIFSLAVA